MKKYSKILAFYTPVLKHFPFCKLMLNVQKVQKITKNSQSNCCLIMGTEENR